MQTPTISPALILFLCLLCLHSAGTFRLSSLRISSCATVRVLCFPHSPAPSLRWCATESCLSISCATFLVCQHVVLNLLNLGPISCCCTGPITHVCQTVPRSVLESVYGINIIKPAEEEVCVLVCCWSMNSAHLLLHPGPQPPATRI